MEVILSFKDKHVKVSNSQIKDLLQKQIKLIDEVKQKQKHWNENEIKIQELTIKVTSMKENLQCEKQALEYKDHDLSKHLDYIAKLKAEKMKFLEENQLLELQRNKLKNSKRNLRDQKLLDQGRRKYTLYKELSGIRWDFETFKENVRGYVKNQKKYIHHFSYKNENVQNLNKLLWQEIYQSIIEVENKEHDKESVQINAI